jgi:NAD(P)-dependent dehydrogenase (short-subunit alcohol dehydrogenase family)
MVDIDHAAVADVVAEIEEAGGRAVGLVADLTKNEDSRCLVREIANAFGGLDFVWNHVGHPGSASIAGIEMKDFDLAIDLNLRTILVTTEAAISVMKTRDGGAFLFTASTSGLQG